jgi:subtilisin family serine protease
MATGGAGSLPAAPDCLHPAAEIVDPAVLRQAVLGDGPFHWWVFLADKGIAEEDLDAALSVARDRLSSRCLSRRARRSGSGLGQGDLVTSADIPLAAEYLQAIAESGVELRRRSRWLNAVSVEVDPARVDPSQVAAELASLPFVTEVRPVACYVGEVFGGELPGAQDPGLEIVERGVAAAVEPQRIDRHEAPRDGSEIDYGFALDQLEQMDMVRLHDLGYSGQGVLVAIFDTGFRKSHESLAGLPLVAERDFVFGDGDTEDEPEDEPGAMSHGTSVWSVIGGWAPGIMIGGAFGADFAVAKTEDVRFERRVEEDNWVAAVEWADSLGADVISSSLAYLDFDDGFGYSYNDLDGRTAVTTLAAVQAHRYGIVVCNAMGNSGPAPRTLNSPADADSILSVGAVEPDDFLAEFSSRGPAADGRIKPDLCGRGTEVFAAYYESAQAYTPYFGGTSGATPFVAAASALLLDVHPEWGPYDVIAALKGTASRADTPDNNYGWGVISAFDAAISSDIAGGGHPGGAAPASGNVQPPAVLHSLAPNPFNPRARIDLEVTVETELRLDVFDPAGRLVCNLADGKWRRGRYSLLWDGTDTQGRSVPSAVYSVALTTPAGRSVARAMMLK